MSRFFLQGIQRLAGGFDQWSSRLSPTLKRILRRGKTSIRVRVSPEGFSAVLRPKRKQPPVEAQWQSEISRWYPDDSFRRLVRIAREHPVELEIPSDLILSQSVRLPQAALSNLSRAIAYGLPMWSPFSADELYLTHSVKQVYAEKALVCLHSVRKIRIDPLLDTLKESGLPADCLILGGSSSSTVVLSSPKFRRIQKSRQIDGALAISALCLVLAIGMLSLKALSHRVERAEAALRSELTQLRQEEALRAAYESQTMQRLVVSKRQGREVAMSEFLAVLAQTMPDTMALRTLEIDGGRGRVEVPGGHAADLLQVLGAVPIIRSPAVEPTLTTDITSATFELVRKTR